MSEDAQTKSADDDASSSRPSTAAPLTGGAAKIARFDEAIGQIELALLVVFLTSLVGVGAYQAIVGNILGRNVPWPFEVIRYSVFFVAMSGAALAAQKKQMMSMDALGRLLSPIRRAQLKAFTSIFVIIVCSLLVVGGLEVRAIAANEHFDVISPSWGLLALPIGSGLIGLHTLLHLIIDASYLLRGEAPPESEEQKVH